MPRRTDIQKIMLLGSGPIVIGQACEFDYSGTQACKVLLEEGYEVVLVNSNPATIMTDPAFSHRTYIEPLTPDVVARIIEVERPDALLPTLGGQTALNLAVALTPRTARSRATGWSSWVPTTRPSTGPRPATSSAPPWPPSACGCPPPPWSPTWSRPTGPWARAWSCP